MTVFLPHTCCRLLCFWKGQLRIHNYPYKNITAWFIRFKSQPYNSVWNFYTSYIKPNSYKRIKFHFWNSLSKNVICYQIQWKLIQYCCGSNEVLYTAISQCWQNAGFFYDIKHSMWIRSIYSNCCLLFLWFLLLFFSAKLHFNNFKKYKRHSRSCLSFQETVFYRIHVLTGTCANTLQENGTLNNI